MSGTLPLTREVRPPSAALSKYQRVDTKLANILGFVSVRPDKSREGSA
jgi:hypothetical protein